MYACETAGRDAAGHLSHAIKWLCSLNPVFHVTDEMTGVIRSVSDLLMIFWLLYGVDCSLCEVEFDLPWAYEMGSYLPG